MKYIRYFNQTINESYKDIINLCHASFTYLKDDGFIYDIETSKMKSFYSYYFLEIYKYYGDSIQRFKFENLVDDLLQFIDMLNNNFSVSEVMLFDGIGRKVGNIKIDDIRNNSNIFKELKDEYIYKVSVIIKCK